MWDGGADLCGRCAVSCPAKFNGPVFFFLVLFGTGIEGFVSLHAKMYFFLSLDWVWVGWLELAVVVVGDGGRAVMTLGGTTYLAWTRSRNWQRRPTGFFSLVNSAARRRHPCSSFLVHMTRLDNYERPSGFLFSFVLRLSTLV